MFQTCAPFARTYRIVNSLKETLNLPKTDFPMRAGLVKREPERIAHWKKIDLYGQMQEANAASAEEFLLHDGPPFGAISGSNEIGRSSLFCRPSGLGRSVIRIGLWRNGAVRQASRRITFIFQRCFQHGLTAVHDFVWFDAYRLPRTQPA